MNLHAETTHSLTMLMAYELVRSFTSCPTHLRSFQGRVFSEEDQLILAFETKMPLSESSCGFPRTLSMPPRIEIPNFSAGNLHKVISCQTTLV